MNSEPDDDERLELARRFRAPWVAPVGWLSMLIFVLAPYTGCSQDGGSHAAQPEMSHADLLVRELADSSSNYVFVAAHRGGWKRDWKNRAPENSLANLEKAIRMGFDVFETDLNRSSDGRLVIMHDSSVARSTDGTGEVRDLSFSDLRKLRLKYQNGNVSDQLVPTFEEFLLGGKGQILFKIDVKGGLDILEPAVRMVDEHGMLGQVFFVIEWSKKNASKVEKLIAGGIPLHHNLFLFRVDSQKDARAAIVRFTPAMIEVLFPDDEITERGKKAIGFARNARVTVVTHSWGDTDTWDQLIELGTRMFHSRKPEALVKHLEKRGLREMR